MTWLSNRFLGRNSARLIVAAAIIFVVLPNETKIRAATSDNSVGVTTAPTNPFEAFRRMLQPTAAASPEPQASSLQVVQAQSATPQKRSRKRSRKARTPAKTEERVGKDDSASEQAAPVIQPLTPFVQVWPHVETGANENTQSAASNSTGAIAPVGIKSDRLVSEATDIERSDSALVEADEENDLDRAAHPSAQPVTLASTDGAAPSDNNEKAAPHNRFSAFAESVKALPEAPWFESVLMVLAGVIAAFVAARIFVRAS